MLFGIQLTDLISTVGVLGLMAIVFAESGLLVGFFLPGDTLLFAAGFLATKPHLLGVNVHSLVGLLFIAAVLGDSVGYAFGRKVGPRIFKRQDSLFFHQDNLQKAEAFYNRYGVRMVVLARFVPVVRTFAPIVAGIGKMNYRTFLIFNLLGGILWTAGVVYLGYFAGGTFEAHGINIDNYILPIVLGVMLLTLISPVYHILHDTKRRDILLKNLTKFKKF